MERRLAAILAADVVGFSRLMEADEAGTLECLKSLRTGLVQPRIRDMRGRIFKLMGDGLLAEFQSVVDAVRCAAEIQHEMRTGQPLSSDRAPIRLRIAVHLGDVMVQGSDIYGDGVNITARLEGLANPDGVCISQAAFQAVDGKLDLAFEDLGPKQLKNIAKPVHVYRLIQADGNEVDQEPDPQPAQFDKPAIAVLPFANMSGDPEQEYFSDGITEDLITEISRFRELAVVSRNSSFVFKGKNEPARRIGAKLNAQFIVEGSVQKAGARVRVTAQLINADTDAHVWAERYDRSLEDLFEVQDDIVRRIAGTLVGRLQAERLTAIKSQSAEQLQAYDLFLRGREHFFNWSIEQNCKARTCLRRALDIDPDNAPAMALLAEVLLRMWLNGWSDDPDADLQMTLELADRAHEIDPNDSRTLTSLGMANLFHRHPDKARSCFETALRTNPNDTRVSVYYSRHAVFEGDIDKAVDLCRQALTLNPYGKYNWNLGLASFVARDYEEAIVLLEAIHNPPESVLALLAASYAIAGDREKADLTYHRFVQAIASAPAMRDIEQPRDWQAYYAARWPFRDQADFEHLVGALRNAGLPI